MERPVILTRPKPEARSDRPVSGPDRDSAWLILITCAVLTLFYYGARTDVIGVRLTPRVWFPMTFQPLSFICSSLAAGGLLGLVPLAWARLRLGLGWRELGLGAGEVRRGVAWLAIGVPVALLAGWAAAVSPAARAVYPLDPHLTSAPGPFAVHALGQLVYSVAWELLFRGVLLVGLSRPLGFRAANAIQTALSVIAHFGRPFAETLAAIPAGLACGGIARTTRSIWYVVLIHWVVGLARDWFILRS
jgi:membrane protease YdiL (CAAX protease family)